MAVCLWTNMQIYFYVWLRCLLFNCMLLAVFLHKFYFVFLRSFRCCSRCSSRSFLLRLLLDLMLISQSIFMMSWVRLSSCLVFFYFVSVRTSFFVAFKLLLMHLLRLKFISLIFLFVLWFDRHFVIFIFQTEPTMATKNICMRQRQRRRWRTMETRLTQ